MRNNTAQTLKLKELVCSRFAVSRCSFLLVFAPPPPVAQVSRKIGCNVADIRNVIVWGNHSFVYTIIWLQDRQTDKMNRFTHWVLTIQICLLCACRARCFSFVHSDTQYPDLTFATVSQGGVERPALDLVPSAWAQGEFISTVQNRGRAIIDAMKKSSAASAANAAVAHMRAWMLGTKSGTYVSMAVASGGQYGVPKDLIFSFPVTCTAGGNYTIVEGLDERVGDFGKQKMKISWEQLQEEDQGWRDVAAPAAGDATAAAAAAPAAAAEESADSKKSRKSGGKA
jgi:hypothetical protein